MSVVVAENNAADYALNSLTLKVCGGIRELGGGCVEIDDRSAAEIILAAHGLIGDFFGLEPAGRGVVFDDGGVKVEPRFGGGFIDFVDCLIEGDAAFGERQARGGRG